MKKTAFTLLELMIAMAIIGVLLGLALFGVSAAQKSQRNTERKAALKDINIGIQQYIDQVSSNPTNIYFYSSASGACIGGTGSNTACTGKWVPLHGAAKPCADSNVSGLQTGTPTSANAKYGFLSTCTGGFSLVVCLEGTTTPFEAGTCTSGNITGCPTGY